MRRPHQQPTTPPIPSAGVTHLLVHGAWHGPWCWERTVPELERRGLRARTVALPSAEPGSTAEMYTDAIRQALDAEQSAVVVAHSMSGLAAVPLLDHRALRRLVLLAAMVPEPGSAWLAAGADPYATPMRVASERMRFDPAGLTSWDPADATDLFYADCEPADAARAVGRLGPDAVGVYGAVAGPVPAHTAPTTYIACTADRAIDGGWNGARAAALLGADVVELGTGHSPFWSAPGELADLLAAVHGGAR